jgi:redox-sensitive bicupin YhaK (pirin superfamily)
MTRLLEAREVPLGGVRAMTVRRALPQRELPMVGAWCFLDQMGPERVDMRVLPHPHIGLQTVTWPLVGQVRHRDSLGSDVVLRPGELNIMTSGRGIAHSEFSLGERPEVHALQLWVALPTVPAAGAGRFARHVDLPVVEQDRLTATVFVGELDGASSPAIVHTPLVGADLEVGPGADTVLRVRPDFEYAVLGIEGQARIAGCILPAGPLLYLGRGRDELTVRSDTGARLLLLGGEPFGEALVMWWNFVGRTHDEIVQARADWEGHSDRFPDVPGHDGRRIPAPPLPPVTLTPRRRSL